ncbi:hypothetical protein [Flavobacterium sp. NKUCC04_CG]|uniref:hypothetical protein n=1 Tax=Flavobacterium sp. NKUCC04_CG TaxID=2842121 RepID=UPI001C5B560F|nr:hypothetical protein [Flavobacterium sp. NKUCC04_CG]MBW3519569.1 hypothetical protein [Flavobacterium sp. NKUCC04_CG]
MSAQESDGWIVKNNTAEASYDAKYDGTNTPEGHYYGTAFELEGTVYNADGTTESAGGGMGLSDISDINGYFGFGALALENSPGSFRASTTKQGFSPKYYGNSWAGNQYTKTFNIGKIGKGLGQVGFGAGLVFDGIGIANYYDPSIDPTSQNSVSPVKAGVNAGMGAWGLLGGPYGVVVSGAYSAIELMYPGGLKGYVDDGVKFQNEINKVNDAGPNKIYLIPRGPK